MNRILLIFLLLGGTTATAGADSGHVRQLADGAVPPPAALADVAWIAGHWQGEALGGAVEEIWSAPAGDSMMGMFRLVADGQAAFYELMVIRQSGESLILQLKHFHGDLKGWEERDETVDFPLVALAEDRAWFAGLTFERTSADELQVWVLFDDKDGAHEVPFIYRRAG